MDETELLQRTKRFGLRVMKLADALPKSLSARIVANQIVRSGTSVGANYRAACKGRSRAEFIAKLGIVEEEADESVYWMEIIIEGGLLKPSTVQALHKEGKEIVAIIAASRNTASGRRIKIANRKLQIAN